MPDPKKLLAARIREARKRLDITQQELAARAGFEAHQTISQIESGEREVKAWELSRLASALHVDLFELVAPPERHLSPLPKVLWRDRPAKNTRELEARFLERCSQYRKLEVAAGFDVLPSLPPAEVQSVQVSHQDAIRLAHTALETLALGSRPADSLIKTLENKYRVKVWYDDLSGGSAAAAIGDFGPAILIRRTEPPWRRNFSAAHELFHLLTWVALPPELLIERPDLWQLAEKRANTFAANLLLPSDSITIEFQARVTDGQIRFSDLIELAREFEVSTEALLWRLANLGHMSKEGVEELLRNVAFRELDRETMHDRWWEPSPLPERFVRLAFLAYQKGGLSRAKLAEYIDTSLVDLPETLAEYGLDEFEDQSLPVEVPS